MKKLFYKKQRFLSSEWLRNAQSTVEYLILLGAVTAVILVGFNRFILRSQEQANIFFNKAAGDIMGDPISKGAADHLRINYP